MKPEQPEQPEQPEPLKAEREAWRQFRQRCYNPNNQAYHNYGGRGIKVCERWHDINCFLKDMGPKPGPSYTLDRIDNDGDYSLDNCRWTTYHTQARNKRSNVFMEYNGKRMVVKDWARATGISYATIRSRIKRGWTVERTLTAPVQEKYLPYRLR